MEEHGTGPLGDPGGLRVFLSLAMVFADIRSVLQGPQPCLESLGILRRGERGLALRPGIVEGNALTFGKASSP